MSTQQWIEYLQREITKRNWCEQAKAYAEGLQRDELARDKAIAERDTAVTAREAALAEITTAREKFDRERTAALADLARVTQEKVAAAEKALGAKRAELSRLEDQVTQTNEVRRLAQGQLDAFRAEEKRETAAITARLEALRTEERAIKERFAAALK
jgi:chromosome segregation ATPase